MLQIMMLAVGMQKCLDTQRMGEKSCPVSDPSLPSGNRQYYNTGISYMVEISHFLMGYLLEQTHD